MSARLLTTREVAERLGIAPETVLRWVDTRGLPAIRLTSRALRYDEAQLEAWLGERTTGPGGTGVAEAPVPENQARRRQTLNRGSATSRGPR